MNLTEVHEIADAVVLTWYPGEEGGNALADILFGTVSPSGRLPITFPKSLDQLPAYEDYSMKGRTYRYMTKEPMYPFGFGLSYTQFSYSNVALSKSEIKIGQNTEISCIISNTGKVESTETVQLYITHDDSVEDAPLFSLKGIQHITLKPRENKKVTFKITPKMLEIITKEGKTKLQSGSVTITLSGSLPTERSLNLGASKPVQTQLRVKIKN